MDQCDFEGEIIEVIWKIVSEVGFWRRVYIHAYFWDIHRLKNFSSYAYMLIILEPGFEDSLKIQDSRISSW